MWNGRYELTLLFALRCFISRDDRIRNVTNKRTAATIFVALQCSAFVCFAEESNPIKAGFGFTVHGEENKPVVATVLHRTDSI